MTDSPSTPAPVSPARDGRRQYPDAVVATDTDIDLLAGLLADACRIVAFTGAGISTESGIPDYRGPGGVWSTGKPPTLDDFLTNEAARLEYWERRRTGYRQMAAVEPNGGHRALVELERSGRLLGAQIVGGEGAAKRIDVLATALWNDMTVEEISGLDLSYAPPFAPVWDPVLIAARKSWDAVEREVRAQYVPQP